LPVPLKIVDVVTDSQSFKAPVTSYFP